MKQQERKRWLHFPQGGAGEESDFEDQRIKGAQGGDIILQKVEGVRKS